MTGKTDLKARLQQPDLVLTPGVFDAFGAMLAEQAGFEALYVSGASIAGRSRAKRVASGSAAPSSQ